MNNIHYPLRNIVLIFAVYISSIFYNMPQAQGSGIAAGRYGVNQVFDVQRTPPSPPGGGGDFTLSSFAQPFTDSRNNYDIGTGHIRFFLTTNPDLPSVHVGISLYDTSDNFVQDISAGGTIYGLEAEGFLYVSTAGNLGTFISNNEGFAYGSSLTYATSSSDPATLAQLQAYAATTSVLGAGEVASSGGSPTFATSIQNTNNTTGAGAARALDSFVSSGADAGLKTAFDNLTTDAQRSGAVTQTLPVMTGGTTATLSNVGSLTRIVEARSSSNIGLSSGNGFITEENMWFKPFYTYSDQNNKNGVTGFNTEGYGSVVGIDAATGKDWRVGLAASYAYAKVGGNNSKNKVNINSYGITSYASYVLDQKTEMNFQIGVGYNKNDSKRIISFGGLNRVARADYNSWNTQVSVGIGHVIDLAKNTTFAPSLRLDYVLLKNEKYTETGADGLNLKVDSQTVNQFIPELGGKIRQRTDENLYIEGYGRIGYDLLTERATVSSNFVGGGAEFQTRGLKPSVWRVRSGAELGYNFNDQIDFSVNYDREDRGSDFKSQTASMKITIAL